LAVLGLLLVLFCTAQLFNSYLLRVEDKAWLDELAAREVSEACSSSSVNFPRGHASLCQPYPSTLPFWNACHGTNVSLYEETREMCHDISTFL